MAYIRTHWVSRTTPLSAANMNNIEDGIVEAKTAATGNETMWTYIRNKISSVLGLTAEQYNGNAATSTSATTAANATNAANAAKVNNHTVNSDVPVNAKFTDTTYAAATTSAAGLMSAADKAKLNSMPQNGFHIAVVQAKTAVVFNAGTIGNVDFDTAALSSYNTFIPITIPVIDGLVVAGFYPRANGLFRVTFYNATTHTINPGGTLSIQLLCFKSNLVL